MGSDVSSALPARSQKHAVRSLSIGLQRPVRRSLCALSNSSSAPRVSPTALAAESSFTLFFSPVNPFRWPSSSGSTPASAYQVVWPIDVCLCCRMSLLSPNHQARRLLPVHLPNLGTGTTRTRASAGRLQRRRLFRCHRAPRSIRLQHPARI